MPKIQQKDVQSVRINFIAVWSVKKMIENFTKETVKWLKKI